LGSGKTEVVAASDLLAEESTTLFDVALLSTPAPPFAQGIVADLDGMHWTAKVCPPLSSPPRAPGADGRRAHRTDWRPRCRR
jgi:hypothetical protein